MGLFKSSNDKDFYDQRAADIQAAVDNDDLDTAAHLMAHAHLEEGPGVFKHLTDANNRNKGRKS
jgi:hypothetical protein